MKIETPIILTGCSALAAVVSALLAWTSLTLNQDTQRAWLSVTPVMQTYLLDETGITFRYKLRLDNAGRLPALGTWVLSQVAYSPEKRALEAQKDICGQAKARRISPTQQRTVFPTVASQELTVSQRLPFFTKSNQLDQIWLIGCADYTYPGETGSHQTRFAYELVQRITPDAPATKIWVNVPPVTPELVPAELGGFQAD